MIVGFIYIYLDSKTFIRNITWAGSSQPAMVLVVLQVLISLVVIDKAAVGAGSGAECGVNSLYQAGLLHNMDITWERVSAESAFKGQGLTMREVAEAATALGWDVTGARLSYEELLAFLNVGAVSVVFVSGDHFAVVSRSLSDNDGMPADSLEFYDYPKPGEVMAPSRFKSMWSGTALVLNKAEQPKPTEIPTTGPDVCFPRKLLDFGEVRQNEPVKGRFEYSNRGTAPLILKEVTTSCSCTAALISDPTTMPGQTGEIEVTFHTDQRWGRQTSLVTVYTNDSDQPKVDLRFTGIVSSGLFWTPRRINFGEVLYDQEVRRSVIVSGSGSEALRITGWSASSPNISFASSSVDVGNGSNAFPGVGYEVLLKGSLPTGRVAESITIYTNHPTTGSLEIPIAAMIVSHVRIVPSVVFFGDVAPGERHVHDLTIKDDEALPIKEVEILQVPNDTEVEFIEPSSANSHAILRVAITPRSSGLLQSEIRIRIKGRKEMITIPVTASVQGWATGPQEGEKGWQAERSTQND